MDEQKRPTPTNREGQPPTKSADDTEARLREKEREDVGKANKSRIEQKIDEVDEGHHARR